LPARSLPAKLSRIKAAMARQKYKISSGNSLICSGFIFHEIARNRGSKIYRLGRNLTKWRKLMSNTFMNLYVKLQSLKNGEEGQDLVEYALLIALISLVCISGVSNVATAINTVFTNISTSLA
jgi:pilus assembly protein Flp/PilA